MIWTFDGNNSMKINEFKSEAGIVGSVIKNKNIVNIGKAKYDQNYDKIFEKQLGLKYQSVIACPILDP